MKKQKCIKGLSLGAFFATIKQAAVWRKQDEPQQNITVLNIFIYAPHASSRQIGPTVLWGHLPHFLRGQFKLQIGINKILIATW